jgi:hypothetical protein
VLDPTIGTRSDTSVSFSQDLPFKRGDTLVIISASKDPNWYKARRSDGIEGTVPLNYIGKKEDMQLKDTSARSTAARASQGAQRQHLRAAVPLQSMP